LYFFFSSRRRHTRWPRDWSSDVCSSDLDQSRGGNDGTSARRRSTARGQSTRARPANMERTRDRRSRRGTGSRRGKATSRAAAPRSEERRVGKECRCRGAREDGKEKKKQR